MSRDVKVGDRNLSIPKFSGYKVVRGGRIVSAVTEAYPSIMRDMARFERDYETENTLRITKAMLTLPRFSAMREELTDEDFGEKGYVEFPSSPDTIEIIASVFPQIMKVAQEEVAILIALVLAPNTELAEKDDDGAIDEYLKSEGRRWLITADADQILEVVVVGWEVIREQFAQKLEGVTSGNLRALFSQGMDSAREEIREEGSTENLPESPTDSPAPTDGPGERSFTEPVGAS